MKEDVLDIVIPARNEPFLQRTILELLEKAEGQIRIAVVLDGYWPEVPLENHPQVHIIHRGESRGMRDAINSGLAILDGEYVMKIDAHCMVDKGFDRKLKEDCEDNWVVIPRRKRLDADNWCLQELDKPDVDYEYLCYPEDPADFGGPGLHGRKWNERSRDRKDKQEYLIDDQMSFQGSCWFMKRSYFEFLELMDEANYGSFAHEAQEIGLKAWLSGGRVVTNKKTWYAHLHKGKKHGRGYFLANSERDKGTAYTNLWMKPGQAWHKQTLPLSYLIERFWPVPTWDDEKLKKLKEDESLLRAN